MSELPIAGNWFLSQLSEPDRMSLDPYLRSFPMLPNQYLHWSGDEQDHVVFPESGVVAIGLALSDGAFVETALLGCEGIVGALAASASAPAFYSARVRLPGQAVRISKSAFRKVLDRSTRMRELMARCESAMIAQVQQSAYCNALHSAEARLCRWLLQMHDRSTSPKLYLTQDLIAHSLGVRRTTVTFVAGQLQDSGAINWRRGYVQIESREQLEQRACDCYRCLKSYLGALLADSGDGRSIPLLNAQEYTAAQVPF